MSIDLTAHVRKPGLRDGLLDVAQMVSGVLLGIFICIHMLDMATILLGPGVMNAVAEFFEATGMAQVGGPALFVVFLVHFVLAARKIPFRAGPQGVIWRHGRMLRHQDTWLWIVQAVTAMIILIMGAAHMWTVLSDLPITAEKSALRIQGGFWLAFFLILLPTIALHTGVGLYRIAVKWGFMKDEKRPLGQRIMFGFIAAIVGLGVLALIRFLFITA